MSLHSHERVRLHGDDRGLCAYNRHDRRVFLICAHTFSYVCGYAFYGAYDYARGVCDPYVHDCDHVYGHLIDLLLQKQKPTSIYILKSESFSPPHQKNYDTTDFYFKNYFKPFKLITKSSFYFLPLSFD